MSKKNYFFLKLIFSFALLVFVLIKYVNVEGLGSFISQISYPFFFIALVISFLIKIINSYQTKISLAALNTEVTTYNVFKAYLVSSFYGLFLPSDFVAGIATWYFLSRDVGNHAKIASVLIFLRILNLFMLFPIAYLSISLDPRLLDYKVDVLILVSAVPIVLALTPFLWKSLALFLKKILEKLIYFFPFNKKINLFLIKSNKSFWEAVYDIQGIPLELIFKIIFMSLLIQILGMGFIYTSMLMVNIHLPILVSSIILILMSIIYIIPITVSGIGLRELSLVYVLAKFYEVPAEQSLILSTSFLFMMLIIGLWGAYYALSYKVAR